MKKTTRESGGHRTKALDEFDGQDFPPVVPPKRTERADAAGPPRGPLGGRRPVDDHTAPTIQGEPVLDVGAAMDGKQPPGGAAAGGTVQIRDPELGPGDPAWLLSPTQIAMYLACPRRWYFAYVEKVPVPERFPLVRGQVVHEVCETFFQWRPPKTESYTELIQAMEEHAVKTLKDRWAQHEVTAKFGDTKLPETERMVRHFVQLQRWKMDAIFEKTKDMGKAWAYAKPRATELPITDRELGVKGVIDAVIEHEDTGTVLVDYKTSQIYKHGASDNHARQLLIYALLYERSTGIRPAYVSVDYLLYGQVHNYPVRNDLLGEVKQTIAEVREQTKSRARADHRKDPEARKCEWCDFYEHCKPLDPATD